MEPRLIDLSGLVAESGVRFGTSGARGLVQDMSAPVCRAFALAFLQEVVPQARRVVLGHDLRPSSPAIARACMSAALERGVEVIFAGALPTPALAAYALAKQLPAIVVTGSHIPFDRNGIKFYTAEGEISKEHEAAIMGARIPEYRDCLPALPAPDAEPLARYRDRYLNFFAPGLLQGKRLGLYEHSSVARDFLRDLLVALGAEVVSLGRTDTFVPVDTEAVSAADQAMGQAWARAHRLDAILSTDGDADRPLIADETGHWLRGDVVGLLCARYLGARVVVTPVSSSTAIERCAAFAEVLRTRIGSPYVIEAMQQALAAGQSGVAGFEANGGFLLGDAVVRDGRSLAALPTRDAVLPMLALLAQAHERACPLSQLLADLPQRYTCSDRLQDFPATRSAELIQRLASDPAAVTSLLGPDFGEIATRNQTDGLRLTSTRGDIIHLRPSGNAPELRCYAESDTPQRAEQWVRQTLAAVLHHGGQV